MIRLGDSARAICLSLPLGVGDLVEVCREACGLNGVRDGYIRVVVTRGVGGVSLSLSGRERAIVVVIAASIALYAEDLYETGIRAVTVPTRRNMASAVPPMIKGLNYLNNILAKVEAESANCHEAILLNEAGFVAECAADNLFVVRGGRILTPFVSAGSLVGITRATIFEMAGRLGIPCVSAQLTRYDLWVADECFGTGTAAEIIPIVEVDGRVVGAGRPGEVALALRGEFAKVARRWGVRV